MKNNIVAITPFRNKNKIFKTMLQNMDIVPDMWIIYNDFDKQHQYIINNGDVLGPNETIIKRIAHNYNILQNIIPKENVKYVYIQEDDIILENNVLSQLMRSFNINPMVDGVGICVKCRRSNTPMIWNINNKHKILKQYTRKEHLMGDYKIDVVSFNSVLLKPALIHEIQIKAYDESKHTLDIAFFKECFYKGYNIICDLLIPSIHNEDKYLHKGRYIGLSNKQAIEKIKMDKFKE